MRWAVPDGAGGARLVIDQSASAIAKSEIVLRARQGEPIEPGWALDADGNATTQAQAALAGSMCPAGGQKGFGAGLMAEIFAAALSGANLGLDASPFSGPKGGPPGTGQFFIAVDPTAFAGDAFGPAMARLAESISEQEGARLPGARRAANRARTEAEGVSVPQDLLGQDRRRLNHLKPGRTRMTEETRKTRPLSRVPHLRSPCAGRAV